MSGVSPLGVMNEFSIRGYLERHRDLVSKGAIFGLRSETGYEGAATWSFSDLDVEVMVVDSLLDLRQRMSAQNDESGVLVFVTRLTDESLGDDVVARCSRRIERIDVWEQVLQLFHARSAAPAVRARRWLPELLRRDPPTEGYPTSASGVLDEERALGAVFVRILGFDRQKPDLRSLLLWTTRPEHHTRWMDLAPDARTDLRRVLGRALTTTAEVCLSLVEGGNGEDLLPLALVGRVLCADNTRNPEVIREAQIRIDAKYRGFLLPESGWRSLAEAAEALVQDAEAELGEVLEKVVLSRADELVTELRVRSLAAESRFLVVSHRVACEELAAAVRSMLKVPDLEQLEVVKRAFEKVEVVHHQTDGLRDDLRKVQRGVSALMTTDRCSGKDLVDILRRHVRSGSYLEAVIRSIREGQWSEPLLRDVMVDVADQLRENLREDNHRFAALYAVNGGRVPAGSEFVALEDVIPRLVHPLAEIRPVLLLVLDGLSFAVYRELQSDLAAEGFVQVRRSDEPPAGAALSPLPTATKVGRMSLFAGALQRGGAADEKRELARRFPAGRTPSVLYHLRDVLDDGGRGLARRVEDDLKAANHRLIALVLNVVDDHLDGALQDVGEWSVSRILGLRDVLRAARQGQRLLVITADHGHIQERNSRQVAADARSARYRPQKTNDVLDADEVTAFGPRVLAAEPLVFLFRDDTRYTGRARGYHGGTSLEEVVVPLAFWKNADELRRPSPPEDGLVAAEWSPPPFWNGWPASPVETPAFSAPGLFPEAPESWSARVLASPLMRTRLQEYRRIKITSQDIQRLLSVFERHGPTVLDSVIATELAQSAATCSGFLANCRRILNVDGLDILSHDPTSRTVRLDRETLLRHLE